MKKLDKAEKRVILNLIQVGDVPDSTGSART